MTKVSESESAIPKPVPSVWKDCKTPHGAALLAYRVDPAKRYKRWAAWVQYAALRDWKNIREHY